MERLMWILTLIFTWDAPVSGATKQPPFARSVRCCGESVAKPRIESGSHCQEIFLFSRRCQKMTKAVLHSASPPFLFVR
jgi:hypothetical protein